MMVYVEDLLVKSLDLVEAELKEFHWHLKNAYHKDISKSEMEKADVFDTVDKMVACFGPKEAVKITVDILRKMNQNDLAEQLENEHKQAQAEGNIKTSVGDACFLTLDPNTANTRHILSEENREVTCMREKQPYPDHPDRFDDVWQVLCRESVSGRCYWEVEWSGRVRISVSYKSISRKGQGKECEFGCNDQSWSLYCTPSRYSFRHNNTKTDLPVEPIISRTEVYDNIYRTGVYVDLSAGTLSFCSISDTMSLIHTVQTTFTQPLYPGFRVYYGSSVKLC